MVPKRFEYCIINIIVRARPISRVPFSRVLSARVAVCSISPISRSVFFSSGPFSRVALLLDYFFLEYVLEYKLRVFNTVL